MESKEMSEKKGQKSLNLFKKLKHFLPTRLPLTDKEMETLISDVISTYNLPDKILYRHAIAVAVQHLDQLTTRKPTRYFAKAVTNQIARETAFFKARELSECLRQEETAKEQAKQEVTLTSGDVSVQGSVKETAM